jgi:hypothetical protein
MCPADHTGKRYRFRFDHSPTSVASGLAHLSPCSCPLAGSKLDERPFQIDLEFALNAGAARLVMTIIRLAQRPNQGGEKLQGAHPWQTQRFADLGPKAK